MFDEIEVPEDFSVVADADLDSLEESARVAAAPLTERVRSGEKISADELGGLQRLAEVVTNVRTERERRTGETPADDDAAAAAAAALEPPAAEAVTASTSKPRVADVAAAAGTTTTTAPASVASDTPRTKLTAPPNLTAYAAGHVYTDLEEVGRAAEDAFAAFSGLADGAFVKTPIMHARRDLPFKINEKTSAEDAYSIIEEAASESRLEGGSLVAAAGWCAPSEIDYKLFELETDAGLVDLPQVQVSRGGLQFTTGPDFSAIFSGAGYFHQTEAQVQAATVKPTMVVPCPSFTELRLEVDGVSITGAFLQDRGYPEMVARFVRGALTAHTHKLNAFKINKVAAGSTLYDYTNVANLPATTSLAKDLTTVSRLLAILGIQVVDYRYRHRMAPDATLEAILPYWVVEVAAQDIQRRTAQDPDVAFKTSRAMLEQWLRQRSVRVQWVYDWQDAYNTTNTSLVGGAAPLYTLPAKVDVLLYAAGTWVVGAADVVRLDTVYDSTNLALNQYHRLFTEEGIMVMKRGFESRLIRADIQPSGLTAATASMVAG